MEKRRGMPSHAYSDYLIPLLDDAGELDRAHRRLRSGQRGRQWGLGSLNRAVVVMSVSAWEAYVEEVLREAVNVIHPPGTAITIWQSLNANAQTQIGRFNNPNLENTRRLLADCIGLQDVTACWSWQNNDPQRARSRLTEAIDFRHKVAHGVHPRPTIHNNYSKRLPGFFRQLGLCTDRGIRQYLVNSLNVPNPWPA
jgi:hypothetical protein